MKGFAAKTMICIGVLLELTSLVSSQTQEGKLPAWHPRHFGRFRRNRARTHEASVPPPSAPVVPPPPVLESPLITGGLNSSSSSLGTWETCERCEGCSISPITSTSATTTEENPCSPCTGCTHQLYAIQGMQSFRGIQYKWEAGASSAHIVRLNFSHPSNGLHPFVKFPCVPSTPKHGVSSCDLSKVNETARALMALQHLAQDCGLSHISVDAYVEHIRGVMPDQPANPATPFIRGGGKVDQLGLMTTAAPGISLSNLAFTNQKNIHLINNLKPDQVLDAALFDFLFCCSDRHAQNIFIDEDSNLKLIDNDLMLGGSQKGRGGSDGSCSPSSLFLPMTMESWRVRTAPSRLGHLDYRCHTQDPDIPYRNNPKLAQCVDTLAGMEAPEIQSHFGIVKVKAAELLKQRAADLKEHGFAKALELSLAEEKKKFDAAPNRPEGESLKHWHNNLWRPLEEPFCQKKGR